MVETRAGITTSHCDWSSTSTCRANGRGVTPDPRERGMPTSFDSTDGVTPEVLHFTPATASNYSSIRVVKRPESSGGGGTRRTTSSSWIFLTNQMPQPTFFDVSGRPVTYTQLPQPREPRK